MSDAPKANVAASTLKMAYAAYSALGALLLSVNALAEAGGVREALHQEWGDFIAGLAQAQRVHGSGDVG